MTACCRAFTSPGVQVAEFVLTRFDPSQEGGSPIKATSAEVVRHVGYEIFYRGLSNDWRQ